MDKIINLPRILIIDDLFGRGVSSGRNVDRESICASYLWEDCTNDSAATANRQRVLHPVASVYFCRGQSPVVSPVGMTVENDINGTLAVVGSGVGTTNNKDIIPWAMVLLDLCFYTGLVTKESDLASQGMPEGRHDDDNPSNYFGLKLLDAIHQNYSDLPVVIMSSKRRDEVSLEFSKRGALGFIDRSDPEGPRLLEEALWRHGLIPDATGSMVGNSMPILLSLREARRASLQNENLLIRGERGTGKELLADYVHRVSPRKPNETTRPFVKVNSAAFATSLYSSELFGIQPRTATGVDGKIGLIESAQEGDLFFDEIADMPGEVQATLLRVLQEKQITRVGGRKTIDIHTRFISATNGDLDSRNSGFRADLYDRLRAGGTIIMPALRDRRSDIPLLVEKFVRDSEMRSNGARHRRVSREALDILCDYDWPGNVRELRSVVNDAVNRFQDVEHLVPGHLRLDSGISDSASAGHASSFDRLSAPGLVHPSEFNETTVLEQSQLLDMLSGYDFEKLSRSSWVGGFPQLQSAYARLIARYIKAALLACRRPTPTNPAGEILIHPAVKLLTGDSQLSATQAADFIKRNLNISRDDLEEILKDEVLGQAYETAIRLRPKNKRKGN
jgi:DNA-binding NtrC family response regulator